MTHLCNLLKSCPEGWQESRGAGDGARLAWPRLARWEPSVSCSQTRRMAAGPGTAKPPCHGDAPGRHQAAVDVTVA